jgi:23S rRNA (adenine2503-C2)-methyltransferase
MVADLNKMDIKELSRDQLTSWLQDQKIEPYRAFQILKWIYLRQAETFDVMTDLGKNIRALLSSHFTIKRLAKIHTETSQDGTRKFLFKLEDGKHIESVLIPERNHYTLCISSQVGCALGCRFCLTATTGLVRNLTGGEMIAQVRDVVRDLGDSKRLTNVVFMGMGEPLANFDNLIHAIGIITDSDVGLKFSSRRVTVSTAGLTHKLSDFGHATNVNLAVSLNATDNRTRSMLMPVNRQHPIEKLLEACRTYPLQPGRRITFEYILIRGVNDSLEDAKRLVQLLRLIKAKINLIPFNEHNGCDFLRPADSAIYQFHQILLRNRYTAIIRHSKGQDISAACGQLRANRTAPSS